MSLINTSKPTTALTNATKASFAELWSTITSTWASETRYWEDLVSVMNNTAVADSSLWSTRYLPWRATAPWLNTGSGISNTAKPA